MSSAVFRAGRRSLYRPPAARMFASSRWYSSTRPSLDEEPAPEKESVNKEELRKIALEFGRRRAAYNRQVSMLRREYMDEYQRHQQQDEAQQEAERQEITRRRLERQRAKNERSVENTLRQEELRRQTQLAFEDHLRAQQEKRDAKKDLYTRAQQMLVDELEEEAHLWLTTSEEVEAAFTPEAEQLLWARPQGVIGVPNPSLDSHFWQYECHTWDMSKTYKTHQDILLEEYEEEVYRKTNIDPEFWTPERVAARNELEAKAKLRANVRLEGRRSLLMRQKEYLEEESQTGEAEPPKPQPIPSLGVLANTKAQEKEGAEVLFKDPTQFFIFDRDNQDDSPSSAESDSYSGPSLGVPIALRDPLRSNSPQGRVFPRAVGKMPKPDMRTEKEKKRQEREEKLWAAAQAQSRSQMDEIDLAADEDADVGEPLDYDKNEDWDSDDEEWVKGLDPDIDSELIEMPRELRYREEDIDWVIESLETKARNMENHVRNSVNSMEQELRSRKERRGSVEAESDDGSILDQATREKLSAAGADADKYEKLLQSLSHDQLLSLFALGADQRSDSMEGEHPFQSIPGLSDEQRSG
eukprot:CAMPEP_0176011202 /NCGR_PEP_ID=MMETSP0120_2-20121206/5164_1 /TAXON_ID=160619 /ORGANISM="Kryptoperidinium foliaceum, Strain CCMP 1326" /LENGTH=581 /DNA_ID=CAMNT_0017344061 /DNA_START=74 /DNA_END=1815 /DNA_ORIENTATION=+